MSNEPNPTQTPPPETPAKTPPQKPLEIIIIEKATPKPEPHDDGDTGLRNTTGS